MITKLCFIINKPFPIKIILLCYIIIICFIVWNTIYDSSIDFLSCESVSLRLARRVILSNTFSTSSCSDFRSFLLFSFLLLHDDLLILLFFRTRKTYGWLIFLFFWRYFMGHWFFFFSCSSLYWFFFFSSFP